MERMVEESELEKLEYLDMVLKETVRLHPVAPLLLPHSANEDCNANGFHIPGKSRVMINIWAIGRDPNVWTDVEKFVPERFDGRSIDVRGRDFHFIPAMQLGITMVQLLAAQLTKRGKEKKEKKKSHGKRYLGQARTAVIDGSKGEMGDLENNFMVHCKEGKLKEACYVHESLPKMEVTPNQYAKNGKKSMMPEPLLWNCTIDCYGRYEDLSTALSVKDQYVHFWCSSKCVYLQCVDPCTRSAAFKLGLQLYDEILRIGFDPDLFTYTALIRGHCVRGDMKEAEELFTKIHKSGLPIDHVPYRIFFKEYC
ncbi:hypothetical protein TB1_018571 [Malus domestica]